MNDDNLYEVLPRMAKRYNEYISNIQQPYNNLIIVELSDINEKALSNALDALVSRHESLRTLFYYKEGRGVLQRICTKDRFSQNLILTDISKEENKKKTIESIIETSRNHLFDFKREPCFRCELIKYDRNKDVLIFIIDHMVSDNISKNIVEKELFTLYDAYNNKEFVNPFTPLKKQLKDYINYFYEENKGDKLIYHQSFFKNLFKDTPPKLKIKSNNIYDEQVLLSPLEQHYYNFIIHEKMTNNIRDVILELKVTFYNFILTAYFIFLNEISIDNQSDFIVDSPISTRLNEDFSKIIGWLTGGLVTRLKVNKDDTFNKLLQKCRFSYIECLEHTFFVDKESTYKADLKWNELPSYLNVTNDFNTDAGRLKDLKNYHFVSNKFFDNLSFSTTIYKNGILVTCSYSDDLINKSEVSNICEKFISILDKALNSPDLQIKYWEI